MPYVYVYLFITNLTGNLLLQIFVHLIGIMRSERLLRIDLLPENGPLKKTWRSREKIRCSLQEALEKNTSISASRSYGIPKITFFNELKGKMGPIPI